MSEEGLAAARRKMAAADVDPTAIEVFAHYYRLLEHGETGLIPEDAIDPLEMDSLADVVVDEDVAGHPYARGRRMHGEPAVRHEMVR
jgi:UTP--glucose-1-phosphate uridylyltransferase